MKNLIVLGLALLVGGAIWKVAETLSPDALGLAIGVVFGVLAGLPTALLVLAGNRRRENPAPQRRRADSYAPVVDAELPAEIEQRYGDALGRRKYLLEDTEKEMSRSVPGK